MKIAACISGQPRWYKEGSHYIKNVLFKDCDVDYFLHTWTYPNQIGERYKGSFNITQPIIEDNIEEKLEEIYHPVFIKSQEQINFIKPENLPTTPINYYTLCSQFYSALSSFRLCKLYSIGSGTFYDIVFRLRYDFQLGDIEKFLDKDMSFLYTRENNSDVMHHDTMAFSSYDNMKIYFNFYYNIDKYYPHYHIGNEELLSAYIRDSGLKTAKIQLYPAYENARDIITY